MRRRIGSFSLALALCLSLVHPALAAEGKIVNGRGNGRFDPQQDITRQELAVVLYNRAGAPQGETNSLPSQYSDRSKVPNWAKNAVSWMVENQYWVYPDLTELKGSRSATRAEVAAVLQAVLEK